MEGAARPVRFLPRLGCFDNGDAFTLCLQET